jgi:hypothetical protein
MDSNPRSQICGFKPQYEDKTQYIGVMIGKMPYVY